MQDVSLTVKPIKFKMLANIGEQFNNNYCTVMSAIIINLYCWCNSKSALSAAFRLATIPNQDF